MAAYILSTAACILTANLPIQKLPRQMPGQLLYHIVSEILSAILQDI